MGLVRAFSSYQPQGLHGTTGAPVTGQQNGNLGSTEQTSESRPPRATSQVTPPLPGPVGPTYLVPLRGDGALGSAQRPSLPCRENNRPVFLSASCNPEAHTKRKRGAVGTKGQLAEGPAASQQPPVPTKSLPTPSQDTRVTALKPTTLQQLPKLGRQREEPRVAGDPGRGDRPGSPGPTASGRKGECSGRQGGV